MRSDPAVFASYNEATKKSPRYVIRISFDDIDFDVIYLTSHTDAATPVGATVISGCLQDIGGTSQKIDPLTATCEIGNIQFNAVDIASAITTAINARWIVDNGLRYKKIVYYKGFEGMAWADYIVAHTYIVDGKTAISYKDGLYKFNTSDIQRQTKQKIFSGKQLFMNGAIGAADLKIPVTGTDLTVFQTVAHDGQYAAHPNLTVGYIKIEKEIIAHTGMLTDATLGTIVNVYQRGALGTQAVAHDVDLTLPATRRPKIDEFIYLEGAAPKLIYAVYTGILYGQGGATLPSHWHAGVASSYMRLTDFENIGSDYWDPATNSGRHLRFEGLKKQDAKKFVEKELLIYNCFMPVYSDGTLGLKRLANVLADAPYVVHLTEKNIVTYGDLKHDLSALINIIEVKWNYLDVKGDFTKINQYVDTLSAAKHGVSDMRTLKFLGVHTGASTEEDLINIIDTLRDRYSGPPMSLTLSLLPSQDRLEVGDVVRVTLPQIRDYVSGTTLDRSFEVQRVTTDWVRGGFTVDLFASSQKAGELVRTSSGFVMPDAFYDPATPEAGEVRIDLASVLTIVAGVITANATLTGHATDNTQAIYCYTGDLTLQDGVTVTWTQNIQWRIKGAWVVNGIFTSAGQGAAGGTGMTTYDSVAGPTSPVSTNATAGTVGGFGSTKSYASYIYENLGIVWVSWVLKGAAYDVLSAENALPYYSLTNNLTSISGLPANLRGSGGGGGGGAVENSGVITVVATGGAGGAGGGGLIMVARDYSYGPNGVINSSGADGGAAGGTSPALGASGAGGAPGAVIALIDGNASAFNLQQKFTANIGAATGPTFPVYFGKQDYYHANGDGYTGGDQSQTAGRVQYIPPQQLVVEQLQNPFAVTSFTVLQNGDSVVMEWQFNGDLTLLAGFEIRYGPQGGTWVDATPLTRTTKGTNVTTKAVPPGAWTLYNKPVSLDGNLEASTAVSANITVTSTQNVIFQTQQAPDWLGTLTNFVKHWTGVLVPKSQNLANADGWDTFNYFVINPYATCTYEAPVIDIGFDDTPRIWGTIESALGPGETSGVAAPDLYIDYKTAAGAYGGFQLWGAGNATLRYCKQKLVLDTTKGVAKVTGFLPTVDLAERAENIKNIAIPAATTTVTFAAPFHVVPYISVVVQGTGLFAEITSETTTGFDVTLKNTSSTVSAGTINYSAQGA